MSRRKTTAYTNVQYSRIGDATDGFEDSQFRHPLKAHNIPWRAIGLAALLFIAGLTMLIAGILLCTGHIDNKYGDRMWPLFILGTIMFIPGAYHVRIAFLAYKEVPGYSFQDIPEFE